MPIDAKRTPGKPFFKVNQQNSWESEAVTNPSVVKKDGLTHMFYRAVSGKTELEGVSVNLSVIGKAEGNSPDNPVTRKVFITPSTEWDKFGCEDPRATYIDNECFIFYTAISSYPAAPDSIKVGLAISKDLDTVSEKHLITSFNSKAMTLLPEKIDGKFCALLTVNTDTPPSKIAVAYFDNKEDMWSEDYWKSWHKEMDSHTLPLDWTNMNHLEVGATPIKTKYGWLFFYCDINDYFSGDKVTHVRVALLDLKDPLKIVGILKESLLRAREKQIFPGGVVKDGDSITLFLTENEKEISKAEVSEKELLKNIQITNTVPVKFERLPGQPVLNPINDHPWESMGVFNPGAIKTDDGVHLLYRAQSHDGISRLGYAFSKNGSDFTYREKDPVYTPREDFEMKKVEGINSGCEDPRLTEIDGRIYMCYTAYTGQGVSRVALTSIKSEDFKSRNWKWDKPILISAPEIYDKDACVLPEKFRGKYLFFHRIMPGISVEYSENLKFGSNNWLKTESYILPHPHRFDSDKIGIGPPPIKTPFGWLLIYHGVSKNDKSYRVGAMLLDSIRPEIVVARTEYPILEPENESEFAGDIGIVFPCGMAKIGEEIFLYFGGGDKNISVAKIKLSKLINFLKNQVNIKYLQL
jgi:predicted GH43/DUF377 family glycosyl hydrolase